MHIVNPPKSDKLGYPISTYTYVIVHSRSSHAAELRKMIFWCLTQGQGGQYTARLTFARLSTVKAVLVASEKTLKKVHA
jgi:ABC-type phosphate transport system substrate-binding protein